MNWSNWLRQEGNFPIVKNLFAGACECWIRQFCFHPHRRGSKTKPHRTTGNEWQQLWNGMRVGSISYTVFHAFLQQGPPSLHLIEVEKNIVMDHLGRSIRYVRIF